MFEMHWENTFFENSDWQKRLPIDLLWELRDSTEYRSGFQSFQVP